MTSAAVMTPATGAGVAPAPETYKLELLTAYGPVFRDVLKTPPRDCRPDEVPVIDVSALRSDDEAALGELADRVREAAEHTGFFYILGHGIPQERVDAAQAQVRRFFRQPDELKERVVMTKSKYYCGWSPRSSGQLSPSESRDLREGFTFRYHPRHDPAHAAAAAGSGAAAAAAAAYDDANIPPEVAPYIRGGEPFVWEGTAHLDGFKDALVAYWQECLALARRLMRVFALALGLPARHFDGLVTYPGADGVFQFYPAMTAAQAASSEDVGIGSHTDLQCFTLLWQDAVGGLQVLTGAGQWVWVPPVPGTLVVNIGDFLMRLSNDRFRSTVHRVWNRSTVDRYSMPFFFGFNFNETCAVLPTCVSEDNPARYEPISCGEWCQLRHKKTFEAKEKQGQSRCVGVFGLWSVVKRHSG
ncbi:hypothetical protein RB601_009823 [Gaeumannomyces tritici]